MRPTAKQLRISSLAASLVIAIVLAACTAPAGGGATTAPGGAATSAPGAPASAEPTKGGY